MRCPKCNAKMDTKKRETGNKQHEYYWCPKCHNMFNKSKAEYDK